MNLLFVHDHPFRLVDGKLYSTGGLNNNILARYTSYCDSLTVVARIIEEAEVNDRWSLIDNDKVRIVGNSALYYKGLKDEINSCDKMIVRLPSFLGIQALNLNKKYKRPYLIEMVACAWDAFWNHGFKGKLIAPYMFLKNKSLIRKAPYVLYVTNSFLQKRYPSKGITIGCSDVEINNIDSELNSRRIEHYKNIDKEISIGTIAALDVPYKGQEYVIKALGKLRENGNSSFNYSYYLVGNGSIERLKKIAENNGVEEDVHFVGGLPHEKVFNWLDTIDLYIQPSMQEGLPRALIEAMSRGLPAIGSTAGGIPELIDKKYLFEKGNYKKLAAVLEKIDKNDLIQMSMNNCNTANRYHKEYLDEIRENFYQSFIAS